MSEFVMMWLVLVAVTVAVIGVVGFCSIKRVECQLAERYGVHEAERCCMALGFGGAPFTLMIFAVWDIFHCCDIWANENKMLCGLFIMLLLAAVGTTAGIACWASFRLGKRIAFIILKHFAQKQRYACYNVRNCVEQLPEECVGTRTGRCPMEVKAIMRKSWPTFQTFELRQVWVRRNYRKASASPRGEDCPVVTIKAADLLESISKAQAVFERCATEKAVPMCAATIPAEVGDTEADHITDRGRKQLELFLQAQEQPVNLPQVG